MMKFIELKGTIYNANQIKSIRHSGYKLGHDVQYANKTTISFVDAEDIVIEEYVDLSSQLEWEYTVVAAQPGFTLLQYWSEDDVEKSPVIAWSIDPHGGACATLPVTVDGIPSGTEPRWGVLQPDGTVVCIGDRIFPNYERWLFEQNRVEHNRAPEIKEVKQPAAQ